MSEKQESPACALEENLSVHPLDFITEIKKMEEIIKVTQTNQIKQSKLKKLRREPASNDISPVHIPPLNSVGQLEFLPDQLNGQTFPPFMDGQFLKENYGSNQHIFDGIFRRKNKKRLINDPSQNIGHWSEIEHKTYINFLMAHKQIMESQDMKKTSKIFKLMSEIIGTRTPSQCRSHHQKFNPFTHHIKKRQKGAGRKRKEDSIPKKFNEEQIIPQFMIPTPPFYMPPGYQFLPELQGLQNPINNPGSEDGMMPQMIDQIMLQQLQYQQMLYQPQQQQQFQQAMTTQDEANKGQYYNFSFIQAPLNLNINYIPQFFQNQEFNPQQFVYPDSIMNDEQLQQLQQTQYAEMSKHHQQ